MQPCASYIYRCGQSCCGKFHSVVLLINGTIRCWGNNQWNQCDPLCITFKDVIQVTCSNKHSVALLSNGTVRCWGNNDKNQCDPVHCTITNVMIPCDTITLW